MRFILALALVAATTIRPIRIHAATYPASLYGTRFNIIFHIVGTDNGTLVSCYPIVFTSGYPRGGTIPFPVADTSAPTLGFGPYSLVAPGPAEGQSNCWLDRERTDAAVSIENVTLSVLAATWLVEPSKPLCFTSQPDSSTGAFPGEAVSFDYTIRLGGIALASGSVNQVVEQQFGLCEYPVSSDFIRFGFGVFQTGALGHGDFGTFAGQMGPHALSLTFQLYLDHDEQFVVLASTTTTTVRPTSTTTTLPRALCASLDTCRAVLTAALPSAGGAPRGEAARVARRLIGLARRVTSALDLAARHPEASRGRYAASRRLLGRLLVIAQAASAQGTLGVSLQPIRSAVNALLSLIPG